jgi:signal transduction histidine kinase
LGLAIAKQLILAHHGTIEVQSEVDKGTTFIIELPRF